MKALLVSSFALLACLFFGCDGFESGGSVTPDGGDDGSVVTGVGTASLKPSIDGEGLVVQGKPTPVTIKIEREAYVGEVNVAFTGLPPGATSTSAKLDGSAAQGTIVVQVPDTLAQGPFDATLEAKTADGSKSASAKVKLFVRGRPGAFDTTFGENGVAHFPSFGDVRPEHVIALPDGKVLIGGHYDGGGAVVARLSENGTFDTSFGKDGVVRELSAYRLEAMALVGGRILGVLTNANLWALTNDGKPDAAFSGSPNGVKSMGVDPKFRAGSISALANGKIVIGGKLALGTIDTVDKWMVVQLLPTGALDASFQGGSASGAWLAQSQGGTLEATTVHRVRPLENGSILIVGQAGELGGGSNVEDVYMTRLLASGAPDPTFGQGGTRRITFGAAAPRYINNRTQVVINGDGRTIGVSSFAGDGASPKGQHVVRFGADGTVVSTTANSFPFGSVFTGSREAFALGADGYVFGASHTEASDPVGRQHVGIFRLTSEAEPVLDFGTNGAVSIAVAGKLMETPGGLAVDAKGRFVCAGYTNNEPYGTGPATLFAARVWP
jgi:uncharacterized delta-60 repeat protein